MLYRLLVVTKRDMGVMSGERVLVGIVVLGGVSMMFGCGRKMGGGLSMMIGAAVPRALRHVDLRLSDWVRC